jgi:RNA polymerase sigma-70 factor (ECF subfamily)
LICEVLGGRKDLFGDLLQPHLTSLFHFVRAKMPSDSEADDIMQTTALKAFTRLDQFRFEATFRTWLMAIALNEILQWRRRRVRSPFVILDPAALSQLPIADPGASPLRECQRRETVELFHRALGKLPEKYQLVIRLRDLDDLSISETAQMLRLSVPAVKSRHHRARLQIVRFLAATRRTSESRQLVNQGKPVAR